MFNVHLMTAPASLTPIHYSDFPYKWETYQIKHNTD